MAKLCFRHWANFLDKKWRVRGSKLEFFHHAKPDGEMCDTILGKGHAFEKRVELLKKFISLHRSS
jgi:hypothetical protein